MTPRYVDEGYWQPGYAEGEAVPALDTRVRDPQRDLPAGLRGGSDTWDKPQANEILASEWFITDTHQLILQD